MNLLRGTYGYFPGSFIDSHGLQGQRLVIIYGLDEAVRAAEDYYGISRDIDLEEVGLLAL